MEQILRLPLRALRESPFNPRRAFPAAAMQELAESIKSQGVMQPIVVRPLAQSDIEAQFEIVFGHRRFRGSQLACMDDIPAIVREMDDEQAAIAQMHENIQREDMTPIDEADGVLRLIREFGMTPVAVAQQMKKSRAWAYAMAKLAQQAAPCVREACQNEGMPGEIAMELARLRSPKLQQQEMEKLRVFEHQAGERVAVGWISTRAAKQQLLSVGKILLEDAVFDPADADLVADAGACAGCPRRAGNDPDLADLNPEICTDSACHSSKVHAYTAREVARCKAAGHQVIEGEAAEKIWPNYWTRPVDHVLVDSVMGNDSRDDGEGDLLTWKAALDKMGTAAPKPVAVVHPREGRVVLCLTSKQAEKVRDFVLPADANTQPARSIGANAEQLMADWSPEERLACQRGDGWLQVRRAVLLQMLVRPRTLEELRIMAHREYQLAGDYGLTGDVLGITAQAAKAEEEAEAREPGSWDELTWYMTWVNEAPADLLGVLLAGIAIDDQLHEHITPTQPDARVEAARRAALARHYGVDVLAAAGAIVAPHTLGEVGLAQAASAVLGKDAGEAPAAPVQDQTDEAGCAGGQHAGDLVDTMLSGAQAGEEVKDDAGASAGGQDSQILSAEDLAEIELTQLAQDLLRLLAERPAPYDLVDSQPARDLYVEELIDFQKLKDTTQPGGAVVEHCVINANGRAWLAVNNQAAEVAQ